MSTTVPQATLALSPTERLLCACAGRADASARRLADLPWHEVSWSDVPPLLARHALTALAVDRLAAMRDRIPHDAWQRLETASVSARAQALAMAAELLRILRHCVSRGLDVLPFKGPILALDAYGDLGARPLADLDLLVRPPDVDRALAELAALGYRPLAHQTAARDAWFRRVDGDYQLVHEARGTLVELHARAISRRFGSEPDTDALWQRRRTLILSGEPVSAIGSDDTLYLQFVHGAKHRWERLEWLAAAAALMERRGGNVSSLLQRRCATPRAVLVGGWLAHELLGAPFDVAARDAAAGDPVVRRLAAEAWRHLFRPLSADGPDETAAKLAFNFRLQRGAAARFQFLYRWMSWPTPEDWTAISLPDPLFAGYRLMRPMRLAWRYVMNGAAPAAPALPRRR